jgi:hypothetical protein
MPIWSVTMLNDQLIASPIHCPVRVLSLPCKQVLSQQPGCSVVLTVVVVIVYSDGQQRIGITNPLSS